VFARIPPRSDGATYSETVIASIRYVFAAGCLVKIDATAAALDRR
jgi:hypothetical protein